jgi:carbonic anhydrase/acetyltransferase-like protein (isoleucine patch superfamily)
MPNLLPSLIIFCTWFGAACLAAIPYTFLTDYGKIPNIVGVGLFPIVFAISFPLIAGAISRFAQKGIVQGTFPREAMHPIYLMRRIYGGCWTQVYYFKPIYAVVLAIPILKRATFRMFGYKGSTDFIVYPDTWIRDLPLLKVGKGAYLSNRATIATNICLSDGNIMVDKVRIEEKALVGHLALMAPGVKVSTNAQVGIGCAVGIRAHLKEGANIKPTTSINHGAVIGIKTEIGPHSFIGLRADIADGLVLPPGSNIPNGAILKTQADVTNFYSSETEKLVNQKDTIAQLIQKHMTHAS